MFLLLLAEVYLHTRNCPLPSKGALVSFTFLWLHMSVFASLPLLPTPCYGNPDLPSSIFLSPFLSSGPALFSSIAHLLSFFLESLLPTSLSRLSCTRLSL